MSWEEFPPFTSSNVQSARYDHEQSILEVAFLNGSVYQYFDVPAQVANAFKAAESKGSFLASNIKGFFRYSRV
ncbi:KTSC domain-containing protein [Luteibacter aegosomaticola]|uniref:KTSC domain-containing protein n=1 Tax=Luteibacter aegosomaticola TaxID=2911538 RepID=UPI003CCDA649